MIDPNHIKTPTELVEEKRRMSGNTWLRDSRAEYAPALGKFEYGELAQAVVLASQRAGKWVEVEVPTLFGFQSRVEEMCDLGFLTLERVEGREYCSLTSQGISRIETFYKK